MVSTHSSWDEEFFFVLSLSPSLPLFLPLSLLPFCFRLDHIARKANVMRKQKYEPCELFCSVVAGCHFWRVFFVLFGATRGTKEPQNHLDLCNCFVQCGSDDDENFRQEGERILKQAHRPTWKASQKKNEIGVARLGLCELAVRRVICTVFSLLYRLFVLLLFFNLLIIFFLTQCRRQ